MTTDQLIEYLEKELVKEGYTLDIMREHMRNDLEAENYVVRMCFYGFNNAAQKVSGRLIGEWTDEWTIEFNSSKEPIDYAKLLFDFKPTTKSGIRFRERQLNLMRNRINDQP
jgi:hypothetical protein